MTNLLSTLPIATLIEYKNIPPDYVTPLDTLSPNTDLLIGENRHLTINIPSGKTFEVRNVVFWGRLDIMNPNDNGETGTFKHRRFIKGGGCDITRTTLNGLWAYIGKDAATVKNQIQEIIEEWLDFERESAKLIGVKALFSPY